MGIYLSNCKRSGYISQRTTKNNIKEYRYTENLTVCMSMMISVLDVSTIAGNGKSKNTFAKWDVLNVMCFLSPFNPF